jgi:hypothetical protein
MRRVFALLALGLLLAQASGVAQAKAEPQSRVALLEIRTVGVSPDVRDRFVAQLVQALRGAGYDVLSPEASQQTLLKAQVPPGCAVGDCLVSVGRALRAQGVVIGGIGATGSNYDITLTMLETQTGTAMDQKVEHCVVCTLDEGLQAMGRAAQVIARVNLPKPQPEVQPAALAPPPFQLERRSPQHKPWYRAQSVRWTAAALAVASLATGVTLVAVDGECSTKALPGHACSSIYTGNRMPGALLMLGGVSLGAGAGYLFLTSGTEHTTKLGLAWTGHF